MTINDYYQDDSDQFEHYAEQFDPLYNDRQARRRRKPKPRHNPKKRNAQILTEIADTTGIEGEFTTTYTPARHEGDWLLAALRTFYEQEIISDVLYLVKGGKEANVYCCRAHPLTGFGLLAAKVYRPRQFRNLRNDKLYRDGRTVLMSDGRAYKETDDRVMRALDKHTSFGEQVRHTSWLMHEYTTLEQLYRAGAAVPQPIASSDHAVLMSYIGDAQVAAPALNEVSLIAPDAEVLFQDVLHNIELMLAHERIHGDLSAYNILYWNGKIVLIDFPQVINYQTNNSAYVILQRDIKRVCEYFSRQGVETNPDQILTDLWEFYAAKDPLEYAADTFWYEGEELDDEDEAELEEF